MTDFTLSSLTFDAMMTEASAIAAKIVPTWNFSDQSDPVRFLLELELRAIERANWFANALAQEFTIVTGQDRRFIVAHAKRLGYTPFTRQPASTTVMLTTTSSATT